VCAASSELLTGWIGRNIPAGKVGRKYANIPGYKFFSGGLAFSLEGSSAKVRALVEHNLGACSDASINPFRAGRKRPASNERYISS
jgi:hypothetical protein